jgi:hypothetical protein
MTETSGGKNVPDPGKSSPTHLEARGAPVHHLDTLPSFDDRKKMAEKLCRVLVLPGPGNSSLAHLETHGAPVDEMDALLSFDDENQRN